MEADKYIIEGKAGEGGCATAVCRTPELVTLDRHFEPVLCICLYQACPCERHLPFS